MSEKLDIEELLREHLLDATEQSPPDLFDKIEAEVLTKKNGKRRFFIFWWIGLGFGMFAASAFIGSFYFDGTEKDQTQLRNLKTNVNWNHQNSTEEIPSSVDNDSTVSWDSVNGLMAGVSESEGTNQTGTSSQLTSTDFKVNNRRSDRKDDTSKNRNVASSNLSDGYENGGDNPSDIEDVSMQTGTKQAHNKTTNPKGDRTESIHESDIGNDLKDTSQTFTANDQTTNEIADTSAEEKTLLVQTDSTLTEIAELDSIPDTDNTTIENEPSKKSKYGLVAYGGYSAFDIAVFKPYFESGALSKRDFASSGFEFGLGAYRKIKDRFAIQLMGSYGQRSSSFTYDLLISEADFFDNYQNEELIPIENLDDPETCNCHLAEDVTLEYKINTIAFSLGGSYDLIRQPKYTFGPQFTISSIASTKFINKQNTIIAFEEEAKETFTGSKFEFGFNFHYKISKNILLGIAPSYGIQLTKKSSIYTKNINQFLIPIQLKFAL